MISASFGYAVVNLGCKVNRVEADGFERLLTEHGGVPVAEAAADFIVVNTCTVTGEAEKKTRKAVRHALAVSEGAYVIVTGCAAAIDPDWFRAVDSRVHVVLKPEMTLFLEEALPSLLDVPFHSEGSGDASPCHPGRSAADAKSKGLAALGGRTRIGIKVQDGCDNACTYCIVHVARGRAMSRPADEVVAEAVALAASGVREIVLTGINLGSYDDGGADLATLCRRLLSATADLHGADESPCRFRIGSIEPMDVTSEFVTLLAEAEGRICRHLHLPLQSGSSRVLREMARPYDAHEFRQLTDYLRACVPSIALTTDIIVGFPGETDEDFEDTCALARHVGFSKIHVFPYSKREGTPAAARTDQVTPEVKAARAARLRALSDELAAADRASRASTVELALVETPEVATIESYLEVAPPAGAPIGSLVPVTL